jgi:hypothetical protein
LHREIPVRTTGCREQRTPHLIRDARPSPPRAPPSAATAPGWHRRAPRRHVARAADGGAPWPPCARTRYSNRARCATATTSAHTMAIVHLVAKQDTTHLVCAEVVAVVHLALFQYPGSTGNVMISWIGQRPRSRRQHEQGHPPDPRSIPSGGEGRAEHTDTPATLGTARRPLQARPPPAATDAPPPPPPPPPIDAPCTQCFRHGDPMHAHE